jgi:hypothetical protein
MFSSIYKRILLPICRVLENESNIDTLSQHLVVLKPDVFPKLFLWTTHGVCSVLESVIASFKHEVDGMKQTKLVKSQRAFYYLQLMATLERVLAYAYTGAPQVLHMSSMTPLWTLFALRDTSFPMFKKDIVEMRGENGKMRLHFRKWPVTKDGYASLPANRAAVVTYNATYAEVSGQPLISCNGAAHCSYRRWQKTLVR